MDLFEIGLHIVFGTLLVVWWVIKYDDYHD